MKNHIKKLYHNNPIINELKVSSTNNDHISCLGLIESSKAFIVASISDICGGQNFVICSDKEQAAYFYNDLENIFEEKEADYSKKRVLFYPTSYKRPYEPEKADSTYILSRTEVLQRLSSSDRR